MTKRFGSLTAVADVSLNMPAGAMVAFLGPNGALRMTTENGWLSRGRCDN